jgi:CheY-like chemotaxis protein
VNVSSPGEGHGSSFIVTLPLAVSATASDASKEGDKNRPPAESVISAARHGGSLAGMRILVVDDEIDARDILILILTQSGAEVRAVGSSQDAQRSIAEWQPDLLISDIAMPDGDGLTLIRCVRKLPLDKGGGIPAIALTAYARDDDRLKAIEAGFHTHLAKPVEPLKLIAVVTTVTGRARNTAA